MDLLNFNQINMGAFKNGKLFRNNKWLVKFGVNGRTRLSLKKLLHENRTNNN